LHFLVRGGLREKKKRNAYTRKCKERKKRVLSDIHPLRGRGTKQGKIWNIIPFWSKYRGEKEREGGVWEIRGKGGGKVGGGEGGGAQYFVTECEEKIKGEAATLENGGEKKNEWEKNLGVC